MADNLTNLNHKELSKKLQDKLKRFSLDDLESFTIDVTFTSNKEISVPNKLTFIPSKYIIVSQEGTGIIAKGQSEWTRKALFLKLQENVASYNLKKTFNTVAVGNGYITYLEDVELVPANQEKVTARITFLK